MFAPSLDVPISMHTFFEKRLRNQGLQHMGMWKSFPRTMNLPVPVHTPQTAHDCHSCMQIEMSGRQLQWKYGNNSDDLMC
jgi:hypothetical protein